ncbi:hypothetical protein TNCT_680891 [Trichonephila clavata]|uniref:Uncharacterized protein n=1 Tax=Trichonephila clavata TaxID=2740835 RepID=A0A8X6GF73_TRICU|nr:hypothetical protein TNCT_680891 [Trichonephila clavata]
MHVPMKNKRRKSSGLSHSPQNLTCQSYVKSRPELGNGKYQFVSQPFFQWTPRTVSKVITSKRDRVAPKKKRWEKR